MGIIPLQHGLTCPCSPEYLAYRTYNKLNRLKAQGRTWEALLSDIDDVSQQQFDIKTIKANATEPHREPNKYLKDSVKRLHDIHFPNPYPKESEALLALYNDTLINFFYQKLIAANRRFSDLAYEPEGCPSIADSSDLSYAVNVIQNNSLPPSSLASPRK